ncbi:TBC1 domain family member 19 isoform X2 [Thalassophryne amazonica]|uniref:TBC1 domain family member 19 isoform X2 n=1 Tax=Thalassophryne amazonica TaxID=390379 RepID=UPI001471190C|nr:TBC1 domain family member 19 isoform X2 [Thalassophryne amazonica]
MDQSSDLSLTICHIVQRLKGTNLFSELERKAAECLHCPEVKLESLKEDVRAFLRASGWEKKLQNAVYRELHIQLPRSHPAVPAEHLKEPLAYMRKAQASWEKRILKSLNSMSAELEVPLARMRSAAEQKELSDKWNEIGTDEADLTRFRPIYAPKDFLEVLISLRNPNHDSSEGVNARSQWGLIQVPLNVRGIPELRRAFSELKLTTGQLGIEDHAHIHPVVLEQDSAAAQQYSRQGCPTGLRADLWTLILNSTNQPQDVMRYEQLKAGVIKHDLLVDNLIYKDVKLTASNDDYYFVFEDFLYQVLLCFSRDTTVLDHFKYNSASPPTSYIQGKVGLEEFAVVYPPNGVIPFHGFSMYVAPLCFLYNEPCRLYSVFREMYIRYFFRLHSISSSTSGVISLCLQFERLLQTHLPQLFYHLRQIGAQPLRIAFKWMVRAFSGYLSTDQLLLLWDRILGYDSLEVVAVLAAAVFAFRAENLMEVTSLSSAEAVLADLSTLKVMPLIQIFLFAAPI